MSFIYSHSAEIVSPATAATGVSQRLLSGDAGELTATHCPVRWYWSVVHLTALVAVCFGTLKRVGDFGSFGVCASLSRRALRNRAILACRFSASPSEISRTIRVVLSMAVSATGFENLKRVFPVGFGTGCPP